MTDTTQRLALPLIAAAQAQKHVTHNEALALLDALVLLSVRQRDRVAPPGDPQEGDRYLVDPAPGGAFAGHAGELACFDAGLWRFLTPAKGWRAYIEDEDMIRVFDGTAWHDLGRYLRDVGQLARLGIGTDADDQNAFAAKLNAALFTGKPVAEGGSGDLRLVLNKAAPGNTVSQLYQSGYGGRAEIGLAGDDDLHIKVSADGTSWKEALTIRRETGAVEAGRGLVTASLNGGALAGLRNAVINGGFRINQRGYASGAALAAGIYGHDRWKAGAAGTAYSVAPGSGDIAVTIAAGSLAQVIEAGMVAGGTYTLSWSGTAPGRINGGAYAASPLHVTLAAGTACTIEFAPGTLAQVQLEPGGQATPFEPRPHTLEMVLCHRFFRRISLPPNTTICDLTNTGQSNAVMPFLFTPMRASPTVLPVGITANPNSPIGSSATQDGYGQLSWNFFGGRIWIATNTAAFIDLSAEL